MFPPGLEPGSFRVLGERDNRYTTETAGWLSFGHSEHLVLQLIWLMEVKECQPGLEPGTFIGGVKASHFSPVSLVFAWYFILILQIIPNTTIEAIFFLFLLKLVSS